VQFLQGRRDFPAQLKAYIRFLDLALLTDVIAKLNELNLLSFSGLFAFQHATVSRFKNSLLHVFQRTREDICAFLATAIGVFVLTCV
jgi:hypothetical protein